MTSAISVQQRLNGKYIFVFVACVQFSNKFFIFLSLLLLYLSLALSLAGSVILANVDNMHANILNIQEYQTHHVHRIKYKGRTREIAIKCVGSHFFSSFSFISLYHFGPGLDMKFTLLSVSLLLLFHRMSFVSRTRCSLIYRAH